MGEEQENYVAMATRWDQSFTAQAKEDAYNSVPPEVIVRCVSYYLRNRTFIHGLQFLDLGCGAGQTTLWLAKKGFDTTGIDISSTALDLARNALASEMIRDMTLTERVHFYEGSIVSLPFPNEHFQGIVEANVIQHLAQRDRASVFAEILRVLAPGGLFCGYMMGQESTVYKRHCWLSGGRTQHPEPELGTLLLEDSSSPYHLGAAGLTHFFSEEELRESVHGFQHVDVLPVSYQLPQEEAKRRGYDTYSLQFWNVYAVR